MYCVAAFKKQGDRVAAARRVVGSVAFLRDDFSQHYRPHSDALLIESNSSDATSARHFLEISATMNCCLWGIVRRPLLNGCPEKLRDGAAERDNCDYRSDRDQRQQKRVLWNCGAGPCMFHGMWPEKKNERPDAVDKTVVPVARPLTMESHCYCRTTGRVKQGERGGPNQVLTFPVD